MSQVSRVHRSRYRLAVLALALLTACGSHRKTDAERAAEERTKIERRIRDSHTLVPYRALKLTLRAQGTDREPEAVTALWNLLAGTRAPPGGEVTPEEVRRAGEMYLKLALSLSDAKRILGEHDEDDYPLLWTKLPPASHETPTPLLPGYDSGMEHLLVGGVLVVLDTADQGNRLPVTDLTLYEFSRATPGPGWPAVLRTASRAGRGLSFMEGRYHYAAEEELTAYLAEVEGLSDDEPGLLRARGTTAAQEREGLLAMGYFLRAWNRMRLERDERAADDVERGLASLAKLGVENELTWWGWALVSHQRGRYEESAASLDMLARSPYLDEPTRQELQANADALRTHGKSLPVFRQQRAAVILVRALVARAGGLEKLLVTALGEERAKQVYEPLAWMDRVRRGLPEVKTGGDVVREAGGVLDKAREAGHQGLNTLKEKLDGAGKPARSEAPSETP